MRVSPRKIFLLLNLSIMITLLSYGCGKLRPQPPEPEKMSVFTTVAAVGPIEVTLADIERDFITANGKSPSVDLTPERALENTFKTIQNRLVFYLEGVAAGWDRDLELVAGIDWTFRQWIGQRFAQNWDPNDPIVISETEIAALEPLTYEKVTLRMMTLPTVSEAQQARSSVSDKDDFGKISTVISVDPLAAKGGKIESPIWRGQETFFTNDTMEKIFVYPEGALTEPIKTSFGWSIFLVEKREPLSDPEIEQRKRLFHDTLYKEKYLTELGKVYMKFPLNYDPSELRTEIFSGYSPDHVVAAIGALEITAQDLRHYESRMGGFGKDSNIDWKEVLEGLASVWTLYLEAEERGLTETNEARSAIGWTRRNRVGEKYRLSLKAKEASDEQLWDYYREEVAREWGESGAGWYEVTEMRTAKLEDAKKARSYLSVGESWKAVFDRYNVESSLEPNGDLGRQFIAAMDWQLYSLLSSVDIGYSTEPLKREDGTFSVFLPMKWTGSNVKTFQEVRDSVLKSYLEARDVREQRRILKAGQIKYPLQIMEKDLAVSKSRELLERAWSRESSGGEGGGHGAPVSGGHGAPASGQPSPH